MIVGDTAMLNSVKPRNILDDVSEDIIICVDGTFCKVKKLFDELNVMFK